MSVWLALMVLAGLTGACVAGLTRRRAARGRVRVRLTVADCEESVEALARGLLKLLAAYGGTAPELTVVDAGSSDDTPEILARLAAEHPQTIKISEESTDNVHRRPGGAGVWPRDPAQAHDVGPADEGRTGRSRRT